MTNRKIHEWNLSRPIRCKHQKSTTNSSSEQKRRAQYMQPFDDHIFHGGVILQDIW